VRVTARILLVSAALSLLASLCAPSPVAALYYFSRFAQALSPRDLLLGVAGLASMAVTGLALLLALVSAGAYLIADARGSASSMGWRSV
jgi:hypothetical protein